MPKPDKNVRRAAVSALRAWAKGHAYADSLVDRHAERNHLSSSDRAFLKTILLGVLRNRSLLDHWIGMFRKGKLDPETRDVLRVGFFQLLILRTPDHAAIYETVACARKPVQGLINAVLRKAAHCRMRLLRELPDVELPIQFSHPHWLWKRWKKLFGHNNAVALMDWNNLPAEPYFRPNLLNPPPLGSPEPESALEAVENGHYYVTDPSTAHAPELLAPKAGEMVLDACAAPGGKAIHLAGLMENEGRLICMDSNEKRLPRLNENIERCGVKIAEVSCHDWTKDPPGEFLAAFDAILLDVPCSNTGVLRRRVDARWRIQKVDLEKLVEIQTRILEQAVKCLKPGGRLVYSTCSIDPEENIELVTRFVKNHPELELEKSEQLLPFKDQTDGAFAALLRRNSSS
ncbi:MAG: transcription antitermination factor NusB [Akkermansiaceae bacterium]|jgi:16S rRNA (cytosine967-C5)-methyltransferase